jgi:hypothetical protein
MHTILLAESDLKSPTEEATVVVYHLSDVNCNSTLYNHLYQTGALLFSKYRHLTINAILAHALL